MLRRILYDAPAFRIESFHNCTFRRFGGGSMVARRPHRTPDEQAFRDHLDKDCRRGGPLISFTRNWSRALHIREQFYENGATEVTIVAVWLGDLKMYDAYDAATELGISPSKRGIYLDEILVHECVSASEYRVLAVFRGRREVKEAVLEIPGFQVHVDVPYGLLESVNNATWLFGRTIQEMTSSLRDEMYNLTGTIDEKRFGQLVLALAEIPIQCYLRLSQWLRVETIDIQDS